MNPLVQTSPFPPAYAEAQRAALNHTATMDIYDEDASREAGWENLGASHATTMAGQHQVGVDLHQKALAALGQPTTPAHQQQAQRHQQAIDAHKGQVVAYQQYAAKHPG